VLGILPAPHWTCEWYIVFQDDWGLSIPSPLPGKTLVKWRKGRSNDLLNIDDTIDTLPFGASFAAVQANQWCSTTMVDSCPNLEVANRLEVGDKIVKVVALLSSTGDVGAGGEPQIEKSLICVNDKARVGGVGILFGICQALLDILECDKRLWRFMRPESFRGRPEHCLSCREPLVSLSASFLRWYATVE
jgi:hypothetical protein